MTTIAYHQLCTTASSGNYALTPINGPLSHQYPGIVRHANFGIQQGIHVNPQKFGVADTSSQVSRAKAQYTRTNTTQYNMGTGTTMYAPVRTTSEFRPQVGTISVSQSTKYNAPKDAGAYMRARKAAAIGQSDFNQGAPPSSFHGYKTDDRSFTRTRLQKARNAGCVAPAKQGSIYNTSLCNGRVCGYGSLVSQNY